MKTRFLRFGRRYARFATRVAVAHPRLWPLVRAPLRWNFDLLAPAWESIRGDADLGPLDAALDLARAEPRHILDLGTGTGIAARHLGERYPDAQVLGVDLSEPMVDTARHVTSADAQAHVRYEVGDATALDAPDGSFDLVVLLNMIPFAGELARITAPGGIVVVVFGAGPETPIYVPPETLRARLAAAGFASVDEVKTGVATTVLARR